MDELEVEDRRDTLLELEGATDVLLSFLCHPQPGLQDDIEHYQHRIQLLRRRLSK